MADNDCLILLPNAINAPDTLLDAHRVPRQVIVEDHARKLKIDAFAADFRRQENGGAIRRAKPLDLGGLPVNEAIADDLRTHAAVNERAANPIGLQPPLEVSQCATEKREHDNLLGRIVPKMLSYRLRKRLVLGIACLEIMPDDQIVKWHVWDSIIRFAYFRPKVFPKQLVEVAALAPGRECCGNTTRELTLPTDQHKFAGRSRIFPPCNTADSIREISVEFLFLG